MRRVRADHLPIRGKSLRPTQFTMARHFVYAAVAPSRSCERPFDDQGVRRAIAFAERAAPGVFGAQAQVSDGAKSLFYLETSDHTRERELAVHNSGLIELLWSVTLAPAREDQLVLEATKVVRPLLALTDAIASSEYAELSKLYQRRRALAKVDWSFMMTSAASPPGGRETWSAIAVPGGAPPRATGHLGGEFPAQGVSALSVKRPDGRAAVAEFLTTLLVANGYHELGDSVARTLRAAEHRRAATT
jgi:hypothetical protein